SEPGPAKMISRPNWAQIGEISRRILGQGRFPAQCRDGYPSKAKRRRNRDEKKWMSIFHVVINRNLIQIPIGTQKTHASLLRVCFELRKEVKVSSESRLDW